MNSRNSNPNAHSSQHPNRPNPKRTQPATATPLLSLPSETKTARASHARSATINAPSPLPPLADEPRARPPPQLGFMDRASEELERRSRYLSSLVRRTKLADPPEPEPERERVMERELVPKLAAENSSREGKGGKALEARDGKEVKAAKEEKEAKAPKGKGNGEERKVAVRVWAADMPLALQRRAIRVALEASAAMPRIDSKRLALALKKEFDTTYGPAWHCIVGKSFGSYVTHSSGGFLYFSIDKVYILLFRTAVESLSHQR